MSKFNDVDDDDNDNGDDDDDDDDVMEPYVTFRAEKRNKHAQQREF